MKLSCVILTKNNEKTINKCLDSLINVHDELIVIDDHSSDATKFLIKKKYNNARIIKRNLNNDFASQRNFAIKNANFDNVMMIDSDEFLSSELNKRILDLKKSGKDTTQTRFWSIRRNISVVGFSDENYKQRPLIFNKNEKFEKKIHERLVPRQGIKYSRLSGPLYHDKQLDIEGMLKDIHYYAKMKAEGNLSNNYFHIKMLCLFIFTVLKFIFVRRYYQFGFSGILYSLAISSTSIWAGLHYEEIKKKR